MSVSKVLPIPLPLQQFNKAALQVNNYVKQESIPVGRVLPTCQLYVFWWLPLGVSTRGRYPRGRYPRYLFPVYLPPGHLPPPGIPTPLWYLPPPPIPTPDTYPWDTFPPRYLPRPPPVQLISVRSFCRIFVEQYIPSRAHLLHNIIFRKLT